VADVAIIDSGGANIASLFYALQRLQTNAVLTSDADVIRNAPRVLLPGVGAAEDAMNRLTSAGLVDVVRGLKQPVLGICLGMQLLCEGSEEEDVECLGIIPGTAQKLIATSDVNKYFGGPPAAGTHRGQELFLLPAQLCPAGIRQHTGDCISCGRILGDYRPQEFCRRPVSSGALIDSWCATAAEFRGARGMRIIPAIDLKDGKCVRLFKGDFERTTEYSANPVEVGQRFSTLAVEDLHIVDLDGARTGKQQNYSIVAEIIAQSGLAVQLGGGIRERDDVARWLDAGVTRCVVGSVAIKQPETVRQWLHEFGSDAIVLALDIKLNE